MINKGLEEYREKVKAGLIKKTRDKNRPSMVKAIKEKCFDCMGEYEDGRDDCEIEKCSLYYFMPYGRLKKERKLQKANQKYENKTAESLKKDNVSMQNICGEFIK